VAHQTFFKHDMPTRVEAKRDAKREAERHQRDVHRQVDQRERYRCRICGRPCDPAAADLLRRGHHHHVTFRSQGGEDSTANEILTCADCHASIHAGKVHVEGNADVALTISERHHETGEWFVVRQELAPRVYEHD